MLRLQCLDEAVDLGPVFVTKGIMSVLDPEIVFVALGRHQAGDWGNVPREDAKANDEARRAGGRIISSYGGGQVPKFWIISEANRSATTVLFPEEY